MTVDVDLSVFTGFGQEVQHIASFLSRFPPRIEHAAEFAEEHRVLLLETTDGIGIDVALGAMPFESNMVDRATSYDLGDGRTLLTCSAEDLLVLKAFANRDRDWLDIGGVLIRQKGQLDLALVARELGPLAELKGEIVILEKLRKLAEESQ